MVSRLSSQVGLPLRDPTLRPAQRTRPMPWPLQKISRSVCPPSSQCHALRRIYMVDRLPCQFLCKPIFLQFTPRKSKNKCKK